MTRFPSKKAKLVVNEYLWHPDYVACPAEIARDVKNKVTRSGVGEICDELYRRRVLAYRKFRPRRQKNLTKHYYLPKDKETITNLLRIIVESGDEQWLWSFINSEYAQFCLTSSLVQDVLALKNVIIPKLLRFEYWDEVERDRLITIVEELEGHHSPAFASQNIVTLHLPVFPDSKTLDHRMDVLESLDGNGDMLKYNLRRNSSGIKFYYERWEKERVIIPILSLVQISPHALVEFLLAPWGPCEVRQYDTFSTGVIDHVIFRLLMRAIDDVAASRRIPASSLVEDAYLSHHTIMDEKPTLFTLSMKDGRFVHFTAQFDTHVDYYGDEDGSVSEVQPINPENCWIKGWVEAVDWEAYRQSKKIDWSRWSKRPFQGKDYELIASKPVVVQWRMAETE